MKEIKLLPVFIECINRLGVAIRAIEDGLVPKPVFTDVSGQRQYRYEQHTAYHVAFLKGVRVVSGLNACLFLLRGGFVQEAMMIVRTLDDFLNEMRFILENSESGALDNHQNKFIEDFFQEEFKNPNNAMLNEDARDSPEKENMGVCCGQMGPLCQSMRFTEDVSSH